MEWQTMGKQDETQAEPPVVLTPNVLTRDDFKPLDRLPPKIFGAIKKKDLLRG